MIILEILYEIGVFILLFLIFIIEMPFLLVAYILTLTRILNCERYLYNPLWNHFMTNQHV